MMLVLDADGDGEVSKLEFKTMYLRSNPMSDLHFETIWRRLDANGDGRVQFGELCAYYGIEPDSIDAGLAQRRAMSDDELLLALQERQAGDEASARTAGRQPEAARVIRGLSSLASPAGAADGSARAPEAGSEQDVEVELMRRCELGATEADVKSLLSRGASAALRDGESGETLVHKLARHGDLASMRQLVCALRRAADLTTINAQDACGHPPLFVAAQHGHAALLLYLLENGAEASLAMQSSAAPPRSALAAGSTVLHVCAAHDRADVLAATLRWAKENGHETMYGAPLLDLDDERGRTPLHLACAHGGGPLVRAMLAAGADARLRDKAGSAPADAAREGGRGELVEAIEAIAGRPPTLFGRAI